MVVVMEMMRSQVAQMRQVLIECRGELIAIHDTFHPSIVMVQASRDWPCELALGDRGVS